MEVIQCKGRYIQEGLHNKVLKDRFIIKDLLTTGTKGDIFEVADLKKYDDADYSSVPPFNSTKRVVKFSKDFEKLASEIKILREMQKLISKNIEQNLTIGLPEILDFGMLNIQDIHDEEVEYLAG